MGVPTIRLGSLQSTNVRGVACVVLGMNYRPLSFEYQCEGCGMDIWAGAWGVDESLVGVGSSEIAAHTHTPSGSQLAATIRLVVSSYEAYFRNQIHFALICLRVTPATAPSD
jgi:hypothetical protein